MCLIQFMDIDCSTKLSRTAGERIKFELTECDMSNHNQFADTFLLHCIGRHNEISPFDLSCATLYIYHPSVCWDFIRNLPR